MIDKEKNTFIMEVQGAFQGKKAVTLKSALKRENEKIYIMMALLLALLLSGCGEKSAPVPVPAPEGDYFVQLAQESVDLLAGQEDAYRKTLASMQVFIII